MSFIGSVLQRCAFVFFPVKIPPISLGFSPFGRAELERVGAIPSSMAAANSAIFRK
jgi:hypothetical protein